MGQKGRTRWLDMEGGIMEQNDYRRIFSFFVLFFVFGMFLFLVCFFGCEREGGTTI